MEIPPTYEFAAPVATDEDVLIAVDVARDVDAAAELLFEWWCPRAIAVEQMAADKAVSISVFLIIVISFMVGPLCP